VVVRLSTLLLVVGAKEGMSQPQVLSILEVAAELVGIGHLYKEKIQEEVQTQNQCFLCP
jgi:hypothetical protein